MYFRKINQRGALQLLPILLVAVLAVGLVAVVSNIRNQQTTQSEAAGKGGPTKSTATLTVTPNPVPANSYFQVGGCGYPPTTNPEQPVVVRLNLFKPTAIAYIGATTDANGCLSGNLHVDGPGSYTLKAYNDRPNGKSTVIVSITFQVQ